MVRVPRAMVHVHGLARARAVRHGPCAWLYVSRNTGQAARGLINVDSRRGQFLRVSRVSCAVKETRTTGIRQCSGKGAEFSLNSGYSYSGSGGAGELAFWEAGKRKPAEISPGGLVDCEGDYSVRNIPSGSRKRISVHPALSVPKSSKGSKPSKSPHIFPE